MPDMSEPRPIRVLVGYDGAAPGRAALLGAGELLPGAQALVVHVRTPLPGMAALSVARERAERVAALSARLGEETVAEGVALAQDAGLRPEPLLVEDERPVWAVLAELAEERGADLIALGARRPAGALRLFTSTADRVAEASERPLLVAPAPPREPHPAGPVVLCHDGSEGAERALGAAAALLGPRPARLLTVWESTASFALRHVNPARAGTEELAGLVEDVAAELDRDVATRAEAVAEAGAALAGARGLPAEPVARRAIAEALEHDETTVWETVLAVGDELDASLLVLGTRGRASWQARAAGSVSRGALHHARRPVLVVP